jgi:hypothetical protein
VTSFNQEKLFVKTQGNYFWYDWFPRIQSLTTQNINFEKILSFSQNTGPIQSKYVQLILLFRSSPLPEGAVQLLPAIPVAVKKPPTPPTTTTTAAVTASLAGTKLG